jgi:hypothetical protein
MLPKGRFSIAGLMTLVVLLAVDLALLKAAWDAQSTVMRILIVTLPISTILLLDLRKVRRGDRSPSRLGFQVAGWVICGLSAACSIVIPEKFLWPAVLVLEHVVMPPMNSPQMALMLVLVSVSYTIPQLLVATAVGRLTGRYRFVIRFVIERRRPVGESGPVGQGR